MIYFLIALIGIFLGYFIAKFTKEELKSGLIYFKILELILLLILIVTLIYYNSFELLLFILGLLVAILIRNEYFYFGFSLISFITIDFNFLISSLVFLYGLPYGSNIYYKKNLKLLAYSLILFILPLFVFMFNYNFSSFAAGGLLTLFILKITHLKH